MNEMPLGTAISLTIMDNFAYVTIGIPFDTFSKIFSFR